MKGRLKPEVIEALLGKLKSTYINAHVPSMNISSTLNLKRELVSMGLSSLFDATESNLGLLSDNPQDYNVPGCGFVKLQRDNVIQNPRCRRVGLYELRANLTCPKELKNPGIFMSHFLHKVNVDLTETRTIASSGTSAARLGKPDDESHSSNIPNDTEKSVPGIHDPSYKDNNVMNVKINRPFLFFIKHYPTNLMLFWGTVNNPTSF